MWKFNWCWTTYKQTTYINSAMNMVFKHYNVCDDIAINIARKVHLVYQNEINKHISVMVGWNEKFDYWRFHNVRVLSSCLFPCRNIERDHLLPPLFPILNKLSKQGTYDKSVSGKLLSNEHYLKYVFSGKKVFSLDSIPRFEAMMSFIRKKWFQWRGSTRVADASLLGDTQKYISLYHRRDLTRGVENSMLYNVSKSVVIDPVMLKISLREWLFDKITK